MFSFKLTKAAKVNPDAFRPPLLTAARRVGRNIDKALTLTVLSWKGARPKFQSIVTVGQQAVTIQPSMTGPQHGRDKWFWLDGGTEVRYAIMSRDWRSKTTPGFIGSGPGRGRKVFVDVDNPQPGIEARGWGVKILKEFRPEFVAAMKAALAAGAKRAAKE